MASAVDPSAPAAHINSPDNLIVDCYTDGGEEGAVAAAAATATATCNQLPTSPSPGSKRITPIKQRIIMTSSSHDSVDEDLPLRNESSGAGRHCFNHDRFVGFASEIQVDALGA
jgi:hypothetical protein